MKSEEPPIYNVDPAEKNGQESLQLLFKKKLWNVFNK